MKTTSEAHEWLAELRAECRKEIYGGRLHFGEVRFADFLRWCALTKPHFDAALGIDMHEFDLG